jgi:hypothetical protein
MRAAVSLVLVALMLAGCAGGGGVPVSMATSDGKQHYAGERTLGRGDRVALTSDTGAACSGDLHPTEEAATGAAAAYGGVRCEDGRIGILMLSGSPADGGGAVSGVMNRRNVAGGWGSAAGKGAGV